MVHPQFSEVYESGLTQRGFSPLRPIPNCLNMKATVWKERRVILWTGSSHHDLESWVPEKDAGVSQLVTGK